MAKQIFVERETFEKNGRTFFSYFIRGNIRGKDVKVAVVPPDKGGYTVLDIVFGNEMSAELILKPYEIKDEATGRVITGNSYAVQTVDEDGEIYECSVKPYRNSVQRQAVPQFGQSPARHARQTGGIKNRGVSAAYGKPRAAVFKSFGGKK